MFKKYITHTILCLLTYSLSLFVGTASSTQNNNQKYFVEHAAQHSQNAVKLFDSYSYFESFLELKKSYEYSNKIKDWKVREGAKVRNVYLAISNGTRLFDTSKYKEALEVFNYVYRLYPKNPLINFERGLVLKELGKEWEATLSFYDALYYNNLPSFRWITDPYNGDATFRSPPEELRKNVQKQLVSMGKSPIYPIDLVLKSPKDENKEFYKIGDEILGRVVPGTGIALISEKGNVNLYLNDSIYKIISLWGNPSRKTERNGLVFYEYDNENCHIGVKPGDLVASILVFSPFYHVFIEDYIIANGAPAKQVLNKLGEKFAFEKEYIGGNFIREGLRYNDYGLTFGISNTDRVSYLHIWTME